MTPQWNGYFWATACKECRAPFSSSDKKIAADMLAAHKCGDGEPAYRARLRKEWRR